MGDAMQTTRRNFIERSTVGVLAGAVSSSSQTSAAPQQPAVTVGIIGVGIRGIWLMGPARDAGAKIAIVCDLYDDHLRRAREIQPDVATTRDYKEVLARQDVQAVIVATSDHWHAPIAIEAMKAG